MTSILAIDPGASGGISIRHHDGSVTVHKMPETTRDLCDLISETKSISEIANATENPLGLSTKAYVEEVSGYAGAGQPGSSMFNFGRGYGAIEGILTALAIPFELIRPQKWQKTFGVGTKAACVSKTEWKNKLKARAQQLFPEQKVTLAVSDALLILEYARQKEKGWVEKVGKP